MHYRAEDPPRFYFSRRPCVLYTEDIGMAAMTVAHECNNFMAGRSEMIYVVLNDAVEVDGFKHQDPADAGNR